MKNYHKQYISNKPFPFIVLDSYINPAVLNLALNLWPEDGWKEYGKEKRAYSEYEPFKNVFSFFFSRLFISQLSGLTGIANLIPDYELTGAGLHETKHGGKLDVHVDFNQKKTGEYRRVNVMIYLNSKWHKAWGGQLELWEADKDKLIRKAIDIMPIFNRMVIFTTSELSFHGHPVPVDSPPTITRKSMAFYYYTKEKPDDYSEERHSTIYRKML